MPDPVPSDLTMSLDMRETSSVVRFNLNAIAEVPWKNGGGITREIASWPPQSDIETFDWRISVARIDRNGPFSIFSGVDRVITLLEGAGVVLKGEHASSHALTQRLAPYAFDGEASIYGELTDGSSEDLNVMSRRGRIQAKVCVHHETANVHTSTAGMLLAVGEPWHVHASDGSQYMLAPGEGLWWSDASNTWAVRPEAAGAAAPGTGLIAIALHDNRAPRASGDTV